MDISRVTLERAYSHQSPQNKAIPDQKSDKIFAVTKVLIIEDEKSVIDSLILAFRQEDYEVSFVLDGKEGKAKFLEEKPDIVILDLMLPEVRGEELCRFIKNRSDTPIIVISAKDSEIDRVVALELGADDYLTKPFSIRELLIRTKKRLKKFREEKQKLFEEPYRVGPFFLDKERHDFKVEDKVIELTPKEFKIMELFLKRPKRVWTRGELTEAVWGHDYVSSKNIDVYIKRLREKLSKHGGAIKTVRGIGYKLEV